MVGVVPMTGLMLDKEIEVRVQNSPGCYGPADITIASAIPNIVRIEGEGGRVVWLPPEGP